MAAKMHVTQNGVISKLLILCLNWYKHGHRNMSGALKIVYGLATHVYTVHH